MRLKDRTQNLPARLRTIQIIVLVLLGVCAVRLYNLQVVNGDYYRERAVNQRLRTLPIPARRGTILDRYGRVLVDSQPVYDVILRREKGRSIDLDTLSLELPRALDIDSDHLQERFTEIRTNPGSLLRDPETPLYNRAIRGRYPPGSTWKIPMTVAAFQQGVITLDDSKLVCGGGIQIGNKFTRCMGHHGKPDLHTAIMKSCDGYFYRLGLKMGIDGIMKMVDQFKFNEPTGIDLPHELVSWTPSPEFKARFNPHSSEWTDIDTVYASFGQVYDFVTPISLLRAIAAVGVGGKLYTPHLLKEARAVGHPDDDSYRPAKEYASTLVGAVPLTDEQDEAVVKAMWSVINEAGTAAGIRKVGIDIAGKTGTAQVVGLGKDVGKNKDHSWFVSYAPAFKPEIAVLALIENSGFGSRHAAPAVRAIYDVYFDNTGRTTELPDQIAHLPVP